MTTNILELAKKQSVAIGKAFKNFQKKSLKGNLKTIGFEIHPDHYDIYVHTTDSEDFHDQAPFFADDKESPLSPIARAFEALPEPKSKKKEAEFDQLLDSVHDLLCQSILEAWKANDGSSLCDKAYAWVTDDAKGIDLNSAKLLTVEKIEEVVLGPLSAPTAQPIAYEPLTDAEEQKIPKFFTEDGVDWTEERVKKEIQKINEFLAKTLSEAKAPLRDAFKKHVETHEAPDKALFLDFKLDLCFGPKLSITGISAKQTDVMPLPELIEVNLGQRNPLRNWDSVLISTGGVLNTSSFGRQVYATMITHTTQEIQKFIFSLWKEMAWKKPAFFRGEYSNLWVNPKDLENNIDLKAVKGLAKA